VSSARSEGFNRSQRVIEAARAIRLRVKSLHQITCDRAMKTLMYLFKCPLCGARLQRFVTDAQIRADSEMRSICDCTQELLGCSKKIVLKPSQGVERRSEQRFLH
jgi:DNA-directed RNA polymerase subunit M/transcription elongation factor TFIIS